MRGASRGIGAATARLAAAGYSLRRTGAKMPKLPRESSRTFGGWSLAFAVAADVSVESDVMRLFETVDETPGRLAGLVDDAGILETPMRLELRWRRPARRAGTNVVRSFLCAEEAVSSGFRRSMAARAAPWSTSRPARPARIAWRVSRLCGLERRHRYLDDWPRWRGRGRRIIRTPYRSGTSTLRCAPVAASRSRRSGEGSADERRRNAGRGRACHPLAALGRAESFTTGSFIDVTGGR